MRVLVVDERVPDPASGAGYPRAFRMVRSLVDDGHRVEMYPLAASRADRQRMAAVLDGTVRFHRPCGSRGLRRLLRRRARRFDVVVLSRPGPLRMYRDTGFRPSRRGRPGIVYDAEALETPRDRLRRALYPPAMSPADHAEALAAELDLIRGVDAILTVSPRDRAIVEAELGVPVHVLGHADTPRDAPGFDTRTDLLFVGRLAGTPDRSPNVDSVVWFVSEVMPRLDRMVGDETTVHLVGHLESSEVSALECDRVILHGVVDDLTELYDRCRVFVAPTRFASGIPHKVTEALSQGIPCVVTRLLADQLEIDPPVCGIADDAEGFARECARLLTAPAVWATTREAGWDHVATACSPTVFRQTLAQVVDEVSADGAPRSRPRVGRPGDGMRCPGQVPFTLRICRSVWSTVTRSSASRMTTSISL